MDATGFYTQQFVLNYRNLNKNSKVFTNCKHEKSETFTPLLLFI